jgi:magnesium-transporting ATPase (P-type)
VAVVFGLALPITSVQVLWVNMVTAVTLSLALAYEPAERGIMRRPPRASGGPIIDRRELGFVLVVSLVIGGAAMGVFYGVVAAGEDIEVARTEAVLMLALGQLAYLFNCRFLSRSSLTLDVLRGNRAVWWSAIALIVLQVIYTYVPFMNVLFDSRPLAATSWILPIVVSIAIFLAVEALKAALRARGTAPSSADTLKGGS